MSEFGFFDGEKYTRYTNAKTLKGAVTIMMKVILRKEEKPLNFEGLTKLYREIGDSVAENKANDGHEEESVIVPLDDLADYFCREGWLTVDRDSLANGKVRELVLEICKDLKVQEEEFYLPQV